VHTTNGAEKMAAFVESAGIGYPVAADVDKRTVAAFKVDSYPDYYLIDRAGNLRVADLANGDLERVLKVLLAEPGGMPAVLAEAGAIATKKDKRILVLWGSAAERAPVKTLLTGGGQLLRYEYEVLELDRAENTELARSLDAGTAGPLLTALRADGTLLARLDGTELDAAALTSFLQAQRVPQKDAEVLWRDALAQARATNRRVLVHLGAPW
jgi:hypothetical protein